MQCNSAPQEVAVVGRQVQLAQPRGAPLRVRQRRRHAAAGGVKGGGMSLRAAWAKGRCAERVQLQPLAS